MTNLTPPKALTALIVISAALGVSMCQMPGLPTPRAVAALAPAPLPPAKPRPPKLRAPWMASLVLSTEGRTVFSVAYSPDGKRLAGGVGENKQDGLIYVWDTGTGKPLFRLCHIRGGRINNLAYSHDGKVIASAGVEVRLWDAATGKQIGAIKGARGSGPIAFAPDGKRLFGANEAEALTVWDISTGKAVRTFEGSKWGFGALSPDGKFVAGYGPGLDMPVKVWEVSTGKLLRTIEEKQSNLTFSPDGKRLLGIAFFGRIWLRDMDTGKEVFAVEKAHYRGARGKLAFTRDGTRIVSAAERKHTYTLFLEPWAPETDGEVKVFDAATGKELLAFETNKSMLWCGTPAPDGRRIAVSAVGYNGVKIWKFAEGD
jgi:WD40 repeat protein